MCLKRGRGTSATILGNPVPENAELIFGSEEAKQPLEPVLDRADFNCHFKHYPQPLRGEFRTLKIN